MRFYQMTLFLLPMLLFTVGCGVDNVEESDANILDLASTDFHFQNFPLAGGSLIPPDEIPVVTIEKTLEDDDFFYWQLKADPAPVHEDLVVGVKNDGPLAIFTIRVRFEDGRIENIERKSKPFGRGVFVIPKLQNTSQELKLPKSFGFKENETIQIWEALEGESNATVTEDVSTDMSYLLKVISCRDTLEWITETDNWEFDPFHREEPLALMDVPIFQTFEGYILREGFRFSYYLLGEADSLGIPPKE